MMNWNNWLTCLGSFCCFAACREVDPHPSIAPSTNDNRNTAIVSGEGPRNADEGGKLAPKLDEREKKDLDMQGGTITETKVVIWRPEKPIRLSDWRNDNPSLGVYSLPVNEVEIRLGPDTFDERNIILRLQAPVAWLKTVLDEWWFDQGLEILSIMEVALKGDLPVDIELHLSRNAGEPLLNGVLAILRSSDLAVEGETDDQLVIRALAAGPPAYLCVNQNFGFRSIRQTMSNGEIIGFDYKDIDDVAKPSKHVNPEEVQRHLDELRRRMK